VLPFWNLLSSPFLAFLGDGLSSFDLSVFLAQVFHAVDVFPSVGTSL
jgi:hypothetical protein